MAQAKKKKGKTVDSWKTKRWYKIKAPKIFEEKELGEAVSSKPELMVGRVIKTTLREITGNIPHQNVQIRLRATEAKGESVPTVVVGHELNRGYVQRQTRRMHSVITTISDVVTKDGYKLRIKALSFGHGGMRVAQEKEVRRITKEYIQEVSSKTTYEKLFQDMILGKMGGEILKRIKRIYPLNKSEIIKSRVLSEPAK